MLHCRVFLFVIFIAKQMEELTITLFFLLHESWVLQEKFTSLSCHQARNKKGQEDEEKEKVKENFYIIQDGFG